MGDDSMGKVPMHSSSISLSTTRATNSTSDNKEKQCDDKDDAKYTTVEASLRMIEEEESDISLSDLDDQQLIDAFEDTWICKDCAAINQSSDIRCSSCDKDKPIPEIIQRKKPN